MKKYFFYVYNMKEAKSKPLFLFTSEQKNKPCLPTRLIHNTNTK